MPTGYTHTLLKEKQTFPQFAMSCARAFGALVEMRDDGMSAEVPQVLPLSDYHPKKIKDAERVLARLKKMTAKQRRSYGVKTKERRLAYAIERLGEVRDSNAMLETTLVAATAWHPPTEDHNGLHKFIVEQLEMSMEDEKWQRDSIVEAVMKAPLDFYKERVAELAKEITYHREAYEKDVERNRRNNEWLRNLRESLPK